MVSQYSVFERKIPELLGQSRVSFLIGAGCSKCAGLPMMNGLTEMIFEDINLDENSNSVERLAMTLLLEIRERYASSPYSSVEDYLSEIQDIDAILTRQELRGVQSPVYPPGTGQYTREHTQMALRKIKDLIRDILNKRVDTIVHHRKFCRAVQVGLRQGRTGHPINYFLLNYDTLIEDALALEGITFDDGFVGGATAWWDSARCDYERLGGRHLEARVYKLHGSIDWIKSEQHDFPMRIRASLPQSEVIGDGENVVIYPSSIKYKETQYDPFSQMMGNFRKHLSETENHVLAIMGYGFNDEHINADILYGLRKSKGALSVVVFLGSTELPGTLESWVTNEDFNQNILVFGKHGLWQDGDKVLESEDELNWYKFEFIADLLGSGVM